MPDFTLQQTGAELQSLINKIAPTEEKVTQLESEIGVASLELNESFEVGTDVKGYKTTIYRCPFRFKQGKTYRIENVSIAGKGLSASLYDEKGEKLQEVGTINPTPALTFVAQQDADFIGGYGTAWKVKISLVDTLEDNAEKGAETHSFVIGAENEVTYESEQGVFLNYNNGLKSNAGSNTLAVSKPIPVSKGQLVVAELSTLYNFVSAIAVTNADGTSHKMVVKGDGNGITRYYYIADKDGYVEVCYDYTLDNKVYISDSSLSQLLIETILSNSNSLPSINIGVDGDSITEGNQWSYYAAQILGANQYNVGVGSACWSYKDKYALDGKTIVSPQHYTDSDFAGFGGASNLDSDVKIQMWVNNNACTHIEKFVANVANGTYPTPDVFVFAMGTNADTSNNNSNGSVDEAMSAKSINDSDFVNENGKSLKYTMCGAMRWCIETIKRNYPNCKVFVSLPIQRASYETNKDYLFPKVQLIKDMAIQMGCQIIDQYKGCGITSAIENDASPYGPYLRDGLHPNTDGQKLMGAFAASQIKAKYFAV